jgi:TonB family protein
MKLRWMCAVLVTGIAVAAPPADDGCDQRCKEAKGMPMPTHRAKPVYPRAAAERRVEGCVVVSFVILPSGQADAYQVLDSQPAGVFDQATLKALNDWTFNVPERPGRYYQTIEYRMEIAGQKNKSPPPECIKPTLEQLNGSAGKAQ